MEETPGTAKTMISMENFCEEYATKEQVEEIKNILVNQIEGSGAGCQGERDGNKAKNEKEEKDEEKEEKKEKEGIYLICLEVIYQPKLKYSPSCFVPAA